ncbi:MAG: AMP-binding protein [Deltaproteobacteria bacterium]|nr:AMP-binding protein [Deltaproteobacteria bacterium]
MKYKNIPEMFFSQVKKYGDRAVQRYKKDGSWVDISWNQMKESAELIGLGLIDLGLKQKDSVCMLSENRPEWAHVDLGIISAGGVNVPIYATNTPQQVQYIVNDAEAQYLFVSNRLQLDKVLKIRGNVPKLKKVIILDHIDANPAPDFVTTLDGLKKKAGASKDKSVLDRRYQATQPDDLITIIYTSGTTGDPKGAMLTHRNILSNCEDIASYVPIDDTFVVLSFLPLSHVFERTAGYYTMLFYGATIAYAESIDRIVDNMAEIRPYAMVSVPRVYEKMYARIVEGVETGPSTKKKIFYWALDTGKQTIPYKLAGKPLPAVLSISVA